LFEEGRLFFEYIFSNEPHPDLIWIPSSHSADFGLDGYLTYFKIAEKARWNGKIVMAYLDVTPISLFQIYSDAPSEHDVDARGARLLEQQSFFRQIHAQTNFTIVPVDFYPLVLTRLEHIEYGDNKYYWSNHMHEHLFAFNQSQQIRGDSAFMAFDIILNAIGFTKDQAKNLFPNASKFDVGLNSLCFECPDSMLPIHVIIPRNPHCFRDITQVPKQDLKFHTHDIKKCPVRCLENNVTWSFRSHGGSVVNVRKCAI
jgi:hypothetical protein